MTVQTASSLINNAPDASGRFMAGFMINMLLDDFSENMGSGIQEFACYNAKLTYDDQGKLTMTRFF